MRPVIAIVGSADPRRAYDPPLRQQDLASQACSELGRELAAQGCDIIVYSSAVGFIEADGVRGYVVSGSAQPGSIQVRSPLGSEGSQFEEAKQHRELFDPRPDTSGDWEVSYYRSLVEAHGVLLLGGERSTFITGLIALAFDIPTVAVATFGGKAEKVWQALDRVRNDADDEDVSTMAADWGVGSAAALVASLLRQRERRTQNAAEALRNQQRQEKRATVSLTIATVLLLLGLATIPAIYAWRPGTAGNLAALIAAPVLVAPCGAIIRNTFDQGRNWWQTAVLGMVAGAVAGLLFVVAQLATTPDVLDGAAARRLLLFVLPVGFIAGLTFDAVYSKLRTADIIDTTALKQLTTSGRRG